MAPMANYLAVRNDRDGVAEMSCIADNIIKLVSTALLNKKII
jgi:hypothetical protein